MPGNYIDHKIDNRVSSQFGRVISGKTDIVTMASGRERRNAAWKFKKMKYRASYALLTEFAQEAIAGAFYACNAQLLLFRFRDPGDNYANNAPLDTTGVAGTRSPVQLTKRYTFGPAFADRQIQAVVNCTVYYGGVAVPGVVDMAMGKFTPTDAWGHTTGYTWSGTFDVWVRFNSDDLDVTMTTLDVATTDIDLIEDIAYAA